jgi:uncharacterized protein HemY
VGIFLLLVVIATVFVSTWIAQKRVNPKLTNNQIFSNSLKLTLGAIIIWLIIYFLLVMWAKNQPPPGYNYPRLQ